MELSKTWEGYYNVDLPEKYKSRLENAKSSKIKELQEAGSGKSDTPEESKSEEIDPYWLKVKNRSFEGPTKAVAGIIEKADLKKESKENIKKLQDLKKELEAILETVREDKISLLEEFMLVDSVLNDPKFQPFEDHNESYSKTLNNALNELQRNYGDQPIPPDSSKKPAKEFWTYSKFCEEYKRITTTHFSELKEEMYSVDIHDLRDLKNNMQIFLELFRKIHGELPLEVENFLILIIRLGNIGRRMQKMKKFQNHLYSNVS